MPSPPSTSCTRVAWSPRWAAQRSPRWAEVQPGPKTPLTLPSAEIVEKIPPLAGDLVRDYVRHVGGDPNAYRGTIPAHLFPQWGFPLAARTLKGIPYPMLKVLNGGCRVEQRAPLPAGVPLIARARLADIDDDGRRAVLHQSCHRYGEGAQAVTGTSMPSCRWGRQGREAGEEGAVRVPDGARELGYFRLAPDAGLAFAMLTGDFNPVHWIKPYPARSAFVPRSSTGSRRGPRIESLNRARFAAPWIGSPASTSSSPSRSPSRRVGVYTAGHDSGR